MNTSDSAENKTNRNSKLKCKLGTEVTEDFPINRTWRDTDRSLNSLMRAD